VGKMSVVEELINPPEKVSSEHDLSQFLCGEPALDDWLLEDVPSRMKRVVPRAHT